MPDQTITDARHGSFRINDLVGLHQQRSTEDLREQMAAVLSHLVPDASVVIRLVKSEGWREIELARKGLAGY